jgi:hypothetical protein
MRTLAMWLGAFALGYTVGVIEKRIRAGRPHERMAPFLNDP